MNVKDKITDLFAAYQIDCVGFIPFSDTTLTKAYLLHTLTAKTCIPFLIPYRSADNHPALISKYSAVRDYHLFASELFKKLLSELHEAFPKNYFLGFADHSPINERSAAARAGLGVLGDNGMLISPHYGSYVFIGTVITDLEIECSSQDIKHCEHCGKCAAACPGGCLTTMDFNKCVSAITQKKHRSAEDFEVMFKYKTVWGCDVCQDVCPMNGNISFSPIHFFSEDIINDITSELVSSLSDADFEQRAFAWRGRSVIYENLLFYEDKNITK